MNTLSPSVLMAVKVLQFVVPIGFLIAALIKFKAVRLIERTPTSKICDLAMGFSEVRGKVEKAEPEALVSPFSGLACVRYDVAVEEYCKSGKEYRWQSIHEEEKRDPFYVRDETGSILVDPKKAKFALGERIVFSSDTDDGFISAPSRVTDYLENAKIKQKSLLGFKRTLRCVERVLCVGGDVYVLGSAVNTAVIPDGMDMAAYTRLGITKGSKGPFYISDKAEAEFLSEQRTVMYVLFFLAAASLAGAVFVLFFLSKHGL